MESLTTQAAQVDNKSNSTNTRTSPTSWTLLECTENVPSQRSLHVGVVLDDAFYIFGGYDGTQRTNDFYKYDLYTGKWSVIHSENSPPSPRDRHAAIVYDRCIYIFGGFDGVNRVNDFYAYSVSKNIWTEVPNKGKTLSSFSYIF